MLIFMFLSVDDYVLVLVPNKYLLKEFMVLCFQMFSLLDNASASPDPSHRGPKQMNQGYVTYLLILWEEGYEIGLRGVCDPCILCRFMEEGGRKCLGFIRFAKYFYYTCMCVNTHIHKYIHKSVSNFENLVIYRRRK